MYRTSCGTQNDDTARFCKECGKTMPKSSARTGGAPLAPASRRTPIGYYLQALEHYADFEGRARRAEFWWFNLGLYGVNILIVLLSVLLSGLETVFTVILWIHGLGLLLPQLAVTARRLHDTERSGWWMLLILIPILGWIPLLILLVLPGDVGSNKYGREPG